MGAFCWYRDEVISRAMVVTDGPLPGTDGKVTIFTRSFLIV